jgi:hypothetical protein
MNRRVHTSDVVMKQASKPDEAVSQNFPGKGDEVLFARASKVIV